MGLLPGPFFTVLFGELSGWAVVASFPGDGKYNKDKGPTVNTWFHWPEQKNDMLAYIHMNKDKDLYTVPSLFKTNESRRAINIARGQVAYADADEAHPDVFRVEPTMVVETSPNRYQLYWLVDGDDEALNPKELADISRRIAFEHEQDGCDRGGWDMGQLMRIPGSTNNKPGLDIPWTVTGEMPGLIHTFQLVREFYPKMENSLDLVHGAVPIPSKLPSLQQALEHISNNPVVYTLFSTEATKSTPGLDRSARMWKLLSEMSRSGVPIEAGFVIAQHAKCNKYAQDGRPVEDLWKEVCKAYADPANKPPTTELDADELEQLKQLEHGLKTMGEVVVEMATQVPVGDVTFLSDPERAQVPYNTIIDRYVEWAKSRTDAAQQYQEAGVLTVLAAVFGDFGYPATRFKMGGLNLWFLVLGGTTRSRKSTARHMMLDTLEALEEPGKYSYDLGSDVTSEGLTVELAENPGRSLVMNRDEVHGLFKETSSKNYLSGLKETLTELYDGRVRGRVRASSGKTDSAKTCFSLWLSGVTSDVTDVLQLSDFGSGFLARFLIVVADPPKRTPENVRMEQMDEASAQHVIDFQHEEIVAEIARARQFWETLTQPGSQVPVGFTKQAWERLNQFNWDAGSEAEKTDMRDVLEPATDRMVKNVMKTALLLAMVEQKTEADIEHVLKAIDLGGRWFSYMLKVAGKIQEGDWKRRQDQVEEALAQFGQTVPYNKAYAAVRNRFRTREFDEILESLELAGIITRGLHNGTKVIVKRGW